MGPIIFVLFLPFFYFCCVSAFAITPVVILATLVGFGLKCLWKVTFEGATHVAVTNNLLEKPLSEAERSELVLHAQVQAEIDSEIEEAVRIAKSLPKTSAEASERLEASREEVSSMEAAVASAEALAKARSGGWGELSEAREQLVQAERRAAEALGDFERFPKEISVGSGLGHNDVVGPVASVQRDRSQPAYAAGSRQNNLGMPFVSPPAAYATGQSASTNTALTSCKLRTGIWPSAADPGFIRPQFIATSWRAFVPPTALSYQSSYNAGYAMARPVLKALRRL
jgi:hypothetical protein